jgi:hypothetical protein
LPLLGPNNIRNYFQNLFLVPPFNAERLIKTSLILGDSDVTSSPNLRAVNIKK